MKDNLKCYSEILNVQNKSELIWWMNEVLFWLCNELMIKLNLKSKNSFRDNYLKPALEAGLIAMQFPDKPQSKNQKYYKL